MRERDKVIGFILLAVFAAWMVNGALADRSRHARCGAVIEHAPSSDEAAACREWLDNEYEDSAASDPRY